MNNPGTTVFVRWYSKVLQGEVVPNTSVDGPLASMVAVRIPLMGTHPVALYTPSHVYTSADEAQQAPPAASVSDSPVCCRTTATNPSKAWQAIQNFKQEHWDTIHNRLRIEVLAEFYQLWRTAVAAKQGITIAPTVPSGLPADSPTVSVDPGSPDGDRSSITITDVATGTIVPYAAVSQQPQPLIESLDQVVPAKLTKKKLRSTSRIQYPDSIQTSIFD